MNSNRLHGRGNSVLANLGWHSMVRPMTLAHLLVLLSILANPSVGSLLLDLETRSAYEQRWTPAMVQVIYRPPASLLEDQTLTAPLEMAGFLLAEHPDGPPTVVAPARRLESVTTVQVRFASGATSPGRVLWPTDGRDVPLARIRVDRVPKTTRALTWAPSERLVLGRRAWVIERAPGKGPQGQPLDPVLVDTSIGPAVEPPLERFLSAKLMQADGLPLLDVDGTVLCAIYRSSPIDPKVGYCTPGEWAFDLPEKDDE